MINLSMADPEHNLRPRLTVMGVGGAGGNAINNMIRCALEGCDFIAANTDSQALALSLAQKKIQLGVNMSRGLGAGSKPDIGRAAAEEQIGDIMSVLEGSDMLFVTAGMGGGTGTGAAPVIARAARESGILTVGVVTKPFHFEGGQRMRSAENGIAELQQYVDTLIVIPNQNLFRIANERTTFAEAFRLADEVLHSGVRGITDLMVMPGFMNLDFADVKTVMGEMGKAMMGTGEADGDNRAIRAAEAAISNPLLDDVSMKGARGVLINITGGMDMTLFEVDQAANRIREEVDPEAQIKVGSTLGEDLEGRIRVSVIATGIEAAVSNTPIQKSSSGSQGLRISTQPPAIKPAAAPANIQSRPVVPPQQAQAQSLPVQPQAHQQQAQQPPMHQQQVHQQPAPPQPVHQPQYAAQPAFPQVETPAHFTMPQPVSAQAMAAQQAAEAQAVENVELPGAFEQSFDAPPAPQPQPVFHQPQAAPAPSAPPQRAEPAIASTARTTQMGFIQRPAVPPTRVTPPQPTPPTPPTSFDARITQLTSSPQQSASEQRRQRRTESLFTRITGFGLIRPSQHQAEEDQAQQEAAPQEQEVVAKPVASPKPESHLGIDPLDRQELSDQEDLLDIPAFLRRQTNH